MIQLKLRSGEIIDKIQKVMFSDSKIVENIEDHNKLLGFFTHKQVQSATLLYRASENEFLVSKFHEKCDNIPDNLLIVKTQFGKVIGGFTAFAWKSPYNGDYVPSQINSPDHFLFSLDNNEKLTLTRVPEKCIYLHSSYGPTFGYFAGYDLRIINKANENVCNANIGGCYTNPNYTLKDPASHAKFSGNKNFKVKQWEMWKLQFKK